MPSFKELTHLGPHTAGMLEIAGFEGFLVLQSKYVTPSISISDTHPQKPHILQTRLGGKTRVHSANSRMWYASSGDAVEIAQSMIEVARKYNLYREQYHTALLQWNQLSGPALLEVARELQQYNKDPIYPSAEEYLPAVNNDQVLAGIVGNRGKYYPYSLEKTKPNQATLYAKTDIDSRNIPLLEAILTSLSEDCSEEGAGRIEYRYKRGSIVNILGKEVVLKADAARLRLHAQGTFVLLQRIQSYEYAQQEVITEILRGYGNYRVEE